MKSLINIDLETILNAFQEAFADYEVQLDNNELMRMLSRRGFNPALSFAAFEGEKIISFTCNGIGNFNGQLSAYDTGTGTLKEYRGKGLAKKVFEYSTPFLKKAGIKQYVLEVLQHNTAAISVYKSLGFEITRELYYYMIDISGLKKDSIAKTEQHIGLNITKLNTKLFDSDLQKKISSFWDFHPTWQNNFESVGRSPLDFIMIRAFVTDGTELQNEPYITKHTDLFINKEKVVGYCIFEPSSGDITQIAVDKRYRRKGIGSLLMNKIIEINKQETIKIVNTDINCESLAAFLKSKTIRPTGKQYEMINQIN